MSVEVWPVSKTTRSKPFGSLGLERATTDRSDRECPVFVTKVRCTTAACPHQRPLVRAGNRFSLLTFLRPEPASSFLAVERPSAQVRRMPPTRVRSASVDLAWPRHTLRSRRAGHSSLHRRRMAAPPPSVASRRSFVLTSTSRGRATPFTSRRLDYLEFSSRCRNARFRCRSSG